MDIRVLEEFCALAKTLNFTKTARSLFMTQPTLSRHIMRLEREIGVELFVEDKTGCSLTRSGEVFLEECIAVVDHYRLGIKRARDADTERVFVRIGGTLARHVLSPLRDYLGASAESSVDVDYVDITSSCIEALDDERIDLAFMFACEGLLDATAYTWRVLSSEPAMAVLDSSNPLAQRESLSIEDLSATPLVLLSHGAFRDAFDVTQKIFAVEGQPFPFKIEIEKNLERVFVRGLGNRMLIFPASAFEYISTVFESSVVAVPLVGDAPHLFCVCAVTTNPVSPSVEELFAILERVIACDDYPF